MTNEMSQEIFAYERKVGTEEFLKKRIHLFFLINNPFFVPKIV